MLSPPIRSIETDNNRGIHKPYLICLVVIFTFFAMGMSLYAQGISPFERDGAGVMNFEQPPDLFQPAEFSGIAYSATSNTLFVVHDQTARIFEYELDGSYRRSIQNNISNTSDMEGISWMYGNTFVLGIEKKDEFSVVTIAPGQTVLTNDDEQYRVETPITTGKDNQGLEGVTFDYTSEGAAKERFYVIREGDSKPPVMVYHIDEDGTVLNELNLAQHVSDGTGIHHSATDNSLYILDRQVDKVLKFTTSGEKIWEMSIGSMRQPEGLTQVPDASTMWVVGEPQQYAKFTNTNAPDPAPTTSPTTPPTNGGTQTIEVSVSDGDDDAEERLANGDMQLDSSDLELIRDRSHDQLVGMRFQNVSVPTGATILSAKITFTADENQDIDTSLTIHGEANPDSIRYRWDDGNISRRSKTRSSVDWNDIPAWRENSTYDTPNLSTVVQEIVNLQGWNSGKPMAFIISGEGRRTADSYNKTNSEPATLTIVYSTDAQSEPTDTPTPTNTPTPTSTPTLTPTHTPTLTPTPTSTPTSTQTASPPTVEPPIQGEFTCPEANDRVAMDLNGNDYAGITLNGDTNSFFVADNNSTIYEHAITGDLLRMIRVNIDGGSIGTKGISWISGNRYAVVGGGSSNIYVVRIEPGQTTITSAEYVIETSLSDFDGIEGVAFNSSSFGTRPEEFYVVANNNPASLYLVGRNGNLLNGPIDLDDHIQSADGLYYRNGSGGSLYIASRDSRKILKLNGAGDITGQFMLGNFEMPEGITFSSDGYTMYLTDGSGTLFGYNCTNANSGPIPANRPPVVTNPGTQTNTTGDTVSLQVHARDLDRDALTYHATNLPNGLSIDRASGLISGTPTESGNWTVKVNVTDRMPNGSAPPIEVVFEWTVEPLRPIGIDGEIYLSSSINGNIGNLSFRDEDIIAYNQTTDSWSLVFDGSDVGLEMIGEDIDAFHIDDDGSILFSISGSRNDDGFLPDVGAITSSDIVRFIPTTLGTETSGRFEMVLDGSDHGLTDAAQNINGLTRRRGTGELTISIHSFLFSGGGFITWQDLARLEDTSGTWRLFFDGSDVGIDSWDEHITGVSIGKGGVVHLSPYRYFEHSNQRFEANEIFTCRPSAMGETTACEFTSEFVAPEDVFALNFIDGIHVGTVAPPVNHVGNAALFSATEQELDLGDQHDDMLDNEGNEAPLSLPSIFLPIVTK